MIKKILFSLLIGCIALTSQVYAKTDSSHVVVINNWFQTINVKEGWISKRNENVVPGRMIDWHMYTGNVYNLNINYQVNGNWYQIPGCPHGDFYGQSIVVHVYASPWDPNIPVCYQE